MSGTAAVQTKRILIVDDDRMVVQALRVRCEQIGLEVHQAYDGMTAMKVLNDQDPPPDLVLLDWNMPGTDGLTLCDMMRADDSLAPVPVILLTGYDNEETRRRCEQLGVYYVRKDVTAWQTLETLILRLLGLEGASNANASSTHSADSSGTATSESTEDKGKMILVIDDDPTVSKGLKIRLEAAGYSVSAAYTGMQGYWMALKIMPDLIFLDYKMPQGWGNTVLGKLKTNPITAGIPVFILSGMTDLGVQRDVVRLGAEGWLNKPFEIIELMRKVKSTIG